MFSVTQPRFELGRCVITPAAQDSIPEPEVHAAIARHVSGDWGEACAEDRAQNEWALENDARVISNFRTSGGQAFWIITEADRSSTTVLLPEDY